MFVANSAKVGMRYISHCDSGPWQVAINSTGLLYISRQRAHPEVLLTLKSMGLKEEVSIKMMHMTNDRDTCAIE